MMGSHRCMGSSPQPMSESRHGVVKVHRRAETKPFSCIANRRRAVVLRGAERWPTEDQGYAMNARADAEQPCYAVDIGVVNWTVCSIEVMLGLSCSYGGVCSEKEREGERSGARKGFRQLEGGLGYDGSGGTRSGRRCRCEGA